MNTVDMYDNMCLASALNVRLIGDFFFSESIKKKIFCMNFFLMKTPQ